MKDVKPLSLMPESNALSERLFSTLKRVKTCNKSDLDHNREKHLIVIHICKEMLDNLDLINKSNEIMVKQALWQERFDRFDTGENK